MVSNMLPDNGILSSIKSLPNMVSRQILLMIMYIYHKFSMSKYIFLVLYVNDILVVSTDICLLHETKRLITINLKIKDLRKAYFVLVVQILRNLSQESYINQVLYRFNMEDNKPGDILIAKGDKFKVGSLIYAQMCTCLDIGFVVGVLDK
ncbi:hypothetical protein CR513_50993, partial [Mucuna pruriens]